MTLSTNRSTVNRNATVTISATASDNLAVTKVEFRLNDILLCTDTTAPFRCSWSVPARGAASYIIKATAYDSTGNTSTHTLSVTFIR